MFNSITCGHAKPRLSNSKTPNLTRSDSVRYLENILSLPYSTPCGPSNTSSSFTRRSHRSTSFSLLCSNPISRSIPIRASAVPMRASVQLPVPSPDNVRSCVWYFAKDGLDGKSRKKTEAQAGCVKGTYRRDIVIRVIPTDLACSYICPSTSLDTALVHSAIQLEAT